MQGGETFWERITLNLTCKLITVGEGSLMQHKLRNIILFPSSLWNVSTEFSSLKLGTEELVNKDIH